MDSKWKFIPTERIGMDIEEAVTTYQRQRKPWERRWYNNNFFDDGYHYRFVSKSTGKIVDLSNNNDSFLPYRAIPKASRQIRGIANLLLANEPVPVIYPEKYQTGVDPQMLEQKRQENKLVAKRVGQWLQDKWKNLDLFQQLTFMVILAAKHGVSYLQVWPDAKNQDINVSVWDAFEIYCKGSLSSLYDSPIVVKSAPRTLYDIKNDPMFDKEQVVKLSPDNKYATSEIKEAYMNTRFGMNQANDRTATVLLKEAFIKEYISSENKQKVAEDLGDDYKGKKDGDTVIRQVYECAGVWLFDKYINLPDYPFIALTLEPGSLYQVPIIERFIPANKTLDSIMSRIERHIGTMAVGAWFKRRGENYNITNQAGGQIIEYEQTPPVQAQVAGFPGEVFAFINQLNSIIEEQGATTSALAQTQPGVKSGVAIESLKASEYANLKIPTEQVKKVVQKISEKMLDIAANYILSPQTVYRMDQGEPDYFNVIGQKGLEKYQALAQSPSATISVPQAIPLKKDYRVEIEIESGMGYTEQGKRDTMIQIIEWMTKLAQQQIIPPEAVQKVTQRFLEIFQFGSTQEFMEAIEQGTPPMTQQQIQSVKVALMEVIKDLQDATTPAKPAPEPQADVTTEDDIKKIKVGFMEALSDIKQRGQHAVSI